MIYSAIFLLHNIVAILYHPISISISSFGSHGVVCSIWSSVVLMPSLRQWYLANKLKRWLRCKRKKNLVNSLQHFDFELCDASAFDIQKPHTVLLHFFTNIIFFFFAYKFFFLLRSFLCKEISFSSGRWAYRFIDSKICGGRISFTRFFDIIMHTSVLSSLSHVHYGTMHFIHSHTVDIISHSLMAFILHTLTAEWCSCAWKECASEKRRMEIGCL